MEIIFKVKGYLNISLDELKPFQGDLKKLSDENHSKLRRQIIEDGFNFCPHVWKCDDCYYILDGHQRIFTLKQLKKEGYKFIDSEGRAIDGIPCNPVIAYDIEDAKRKVLQAVSQYGKLDTEGFKDFVIDVDFDLGDFDLPDFEIPYFGIDEFNFDPKNTDDNEKPKDFILKVVCESDTELDEIFLELNDRGYKVKR